MNARVQAVDPDTDPLQLRIFCEYDDRHGNGPMISFSFLSAADDAAAASKLSQVKAIGAVGQILPIWETVNDDGKVEVLMVVLPEAGKELVEALSLDHLDDAMSSQSKP
ncbi:MAG: hypothetical protein WKF61_05780 [Luteimonas sp.]